MHVFSFTNLFYDLFLLLFLGIAREKRDGRGSRGEDGWFVKYESIELRRIALNINIGVLENH